VNDPLPRPIAYKLDRFCAAAPSPASAARLNLGPGMKWGFKDGSYGGSGGGAAGYNGGSGGGSVIDQGNDGGGRKW